MGKGGNAGNQHFLLAPQYFFHVQENSTTSNIYMFRNVSKSFQFEPVWNSDIISLIIEDIYYELGFVVIYQKGNPSQMHRYP